MKLLLLAPCGLTNEPEDTRYINLYLASLKKHVVPYFDVKVLLYNNSSNTNSQESLTLQRVREFGLDNQIEVKNVFEMELPEASLNFVKELPWQSKIGIVMNLLFDYSKRNNFFDADWIFHTDTDIEFLPNFKDNLEKINQIISVQPQVVISLAGDTYPYHFSYNNTQFVFDEPRRLNLYNTDENISQAFSYRRLEYKPGQEENVDLSVKDVLVFNLQQQKTRNDFVGISRQAANHAQFNWVGCHYPVSFNAIDRDGLGIDVGADILEQIWKEVSNDRLKIHINHDKGSIPQFQMQKGLFDIVKIQLRNYQDMAKHFGSGYFATNRSWIDESRETLEKDYQEYKDIWGKDYQSVNQEKVSIENRISELEKTLNELKEMIKNM